MSILDNVVDFVKKEYAAGSNAVYKAAAAVSDYTGLTKWMAKANEVWAKYQRALADATKLNAQIDDPSLRQQYNTIAADAATFTQIYNEAKRRFTEALGNNGPGLGFIPVLIGGAIIFIAYFMDKIANAGLPAVTAYIARAQTYKMHVEAGQTKLDAMEAADAAASSAQSATKDLMGSSLGDLLGSTTTKLVLGAVVLGGAYLYLSRRK